MVVYLDLLLILNFIYDYLLLMTVTIVLKRNTSWKRLLVGALIGMISTLIIFIPLNEYILFILKIIIGIIMIIVTYQYKDFKYTINNIIYLYMCSVILGGFLYYLKIEFNNFAYPITLLIAPLILYLYIKEQRKLRQVLNFYKKVIITFKNNKQIELNGFIDSGNKLKDIITNKYIIIINKKSIKGIYNIRSPMYVPIKTVNKNSLLTCISIKNIMIDNKVYHNYLLGITEEFNSSDGIECLLNYHLLEE